MRIGFDAKRAFNNTSGLGNYSRNTISLLAKYFPANEYYLYTPSINGSLDFSLPDGSHLRKPGRFTGRIAGSFWRSAMLGSFLENDGIDLYHGLSHELPVRMGNSPVKKVVTIHDMIPYRHPGMFTAVNRFIYRKKINHSCSRADRIIAISRQTKSDIEEFTGVDPAIVEVIYQACDPAYYLRADEDTRARVRLKYNLPSGYILSVGTIEPRKNLPGVIRAMQAGKIDTPLVVVGKKTGFLDTVLSDIHHSGIKNVLFLENIPVNDLAAIYQMAGLFVYPSFYEGFGIPVLEALSSGTPVITSSGSCFSETAGPDSLYVDPHNHEELAAALTNVLTDSSLREKMVSGGLKHSGNFQHERIAEKLMEVYNATLKGGNYEG